MSIFGRSWPILTLIWLAASAAVVPARASDTIRVAGPRAVTPIVQSAWETFVRRHPDLSLELLPHGTTRGIAAVGGGQVSLGLTSRALRHGELARFPDLREHLIGAEGIAVVVHPTNPLGGVTRDELRRIYLGVHTRWEELQPVPGTLRGPIQVVSVMASDPSFAPFANSLGISAAGLGGAVVLSSEEDGERVSLRVRGQDGAPSLLRAVAENPAAIGFVRLGHLDRLTTHAVRVLSIDDVQPTPETLADGEYPLRRPLLLVTNGDPRGAVKDFLDFARSRDVQAAMESHGYVAVGTQ